VGSKKEQLETAIEAKPARIGKFRSNTEYDNNDGLRQLPIPTAPKKTNGSNRQAKKGSVTEGKGRKGTFKNLGNWSGNKVKKIGGEREGFGSTSIVELGVGHRFKIEVLEEARSKRYSLGEARKRRHTIDEKVEGRDTRGTQKNVTPRQKG